MKATEEKKMNRYRNWFAIMAVQFVAVGIFAIGGARAGIIQDIPSAVSETLGVSIQVAGLILSCGILLCVALLISMSGKNPNMIATSAVMLATVGTLTAISWLYSWLIVMLAIVIALMFAGTLRDWSESSKK
jgi:hypothetical protein